MGTNSFSWWSALAIAAPSMAICIVAAGCAGKAEPREALPTAHHLATMVLTPIQLPKSDLVLSYRSGKLGAYAAAQFVPDQKADVYTQGWLDGYAIIQDPPPTYDSYQFDQLMQGVEPDPVMQTMNYVGLFDSEASASDAVQAQIDRTLEANPDAGILNAEVLPVDGFGEDAYAARLDLVNGTGEVFMTSVTFRHGQLVGGVVFVQARQVDILAQVTGLALELDKQITRVLENEGSKRPWTLPDPPIGDTLGLRCSVPSNFLRTRYGLEPGEGCVVLRVTGYSAAERAGFRIGDRIVEMDERPITSGEQFTYEFEVRPSLGPTHTFAIDRGTQRLNLRVVLGTESYEPWFDPYEDYLRARGNPDDAEAIFYYTQAIAKDPEFDLAYLYRGRARMHVAPFLDEARSAESDLLAALRLDADLAEAHESMAQWITTSSTGTIAAALGELTTAIELSGCRPPVGSWDSDCGRLLQQRAQAYMIAKNYRGAAADLTAIESVEKGRDDLFLIWDRLNQELGEPQ